MGIWQLAQASLVLGVLLHTIYPIHGECSIRKDFNRMFFPINFPPHSDYEPVVIMWIGVLRGGVPIHFVPLLPAQYAQ